MKTVGSFLGALGVVWLAACSGSNSTLLSTVGDGGIGGGASSTSLATQTSASATATASATGSMTAVGTGSGSVVTTSATTATTTPVTTTSSTSMTTSSTSTPPPPSVVCGTTSCMGAMPICCVGGGTAAGGRSTCVATANDCNSGVVRVCDGVDNCMKNQLCCPAGNGGTQCAANCGGAAAVCQTNADCSGAMDNGVAVPFCQTTAGNQLMNRCVECTVASADAPAQGCTGNQRCLAGRCM